VFLDYDPSVNRENAAPPNGARPKHADERLGTGGGWRQKPGTGAIRRLPISSPLSYPKIASGRRADRHKNQQQEDDHEFSQDAQDSVQI
jgi:hypothetical protein